MHDCPRRRAQIKEFAVYDCKEMEDHGIHEKGWKENSFQNVATNVTDASKSHLRGYLRSKVLVLDIMAAVESISSEMGAVVHRLWVVCYGTRWNRDASIAGWKLFPFTSVTDFLILSKAAQSGDLENI